MPDGLGVSKRFYAVWWPLLDFVNSIERIAPGTVFAGQEGHLPPKTCLAVRDALWAHPDLLAQFARENPAHLGPDELLLVSSWKDRVEGTFFVYRHLKEHSVFLGSDSGSSAYEVKPLLSPFSEVVGPFLPVAVKGVLLPVDQDITYDGLFQTYPIVFGSGIKRSLKETYERAVSRGAIIVSLPPKAKGVDVASVLPHLRRRNAKLLDEFRKHSYIAGRASKTVEGDAGFLMKLAEERLLRQEPPRELADLAATDLVSASSANDRELGISYPPREWATLRRFARFLFETGRINAATMRQFEGTR
jgi:hypothetical protein